MTAFGDEDVRRLYVSVNDASGVGGIQRIGDLDAKGKCRLHIQWLSCDPRFQSHSIQKLHGNESVTILLAYVVNCADIGMVQRGCGLCLAPETAQSLRVFCHFVRQEFERHKPI